MRREKCLVCMKPLRGDGPYCCPEHEARAATPEAYRDTGRSLPYVDRSKSAEPIGVRGQSCAVCGRSVSLAKRKYCSVNCNKTAWRQRFKAKGGTDGGQEPASA